MADSLEASEAPAPVAIFKKRGAKGKSTRKREPTPPTKDDSDTDFSSSEDESGVRVKRRRITKGTVKASSKDMAVAEKDLSTTIFEADRNLALDKSNDATKTVHWFDENAEDAMSAKNLLGSRRQRQNGGAGPSEDGPDGTYKGLANQASYIKKNPNAPKRAVGPIKAPSNIRTITITDMAPDVCKDYKVSSTAREELLTRWLATDTPMCS
jgi:RING finger protein 113A